MYGPGCWRIFAKPADFNREVKMEKELLEEAIDTISLLLEFELGVPATT